MNIKDTIKSLLARAKDHAATEAEIASAAAQIDRLLTKHNLTLEECETNDRQMGTQTAKNNMKKAPYVDTFMSRAFAKWLGVFVVINRMEGAVHYHGEKLDVEIALYFRDLCENACKSAWNAHKKNVGHGKNRTDFYKAFFTRLSDRILNMIEPQKTSTGQDLVVDKFTLVRQDYLENCGGKFRRTKRKGYRQNAAAMMAQAAADKVNLSKGVSGQKAQLLLA